jgi:hypothetical protein
MSYDIITRGFCPFIYFYFIFVKVLKIITNFSMSEVVYVDDDKMCGNFFLQAYIFSKSQEADVLFNKTSMTLTMPITT